MQRVTYLLIAILFTGIGCSRNSAQPAVQSADDIDMTEASETEEEYRSELDDGSYSPFLIGELDESSLDISAGEGDVQMTNFADELVGWSWGSAENREVYDAVASMEEFGGRALIPLAHFKRENRHVLVAWPALTFDGELTDAAVYGACVVENDGSYAPCEQKIWLVDGVTSSRRAIEVVLGGADYVIVSDQTSASLDVLGPRLTELGNDIVSASSERDEVALFRAVQEFIVMLPVDDVAFSDAVPRLLVSAAHGGKEFRHMKTQIGDLLAGMMINVFGEHHQATTLSLTAQQIETTDDWRIVDFW